MGASEIYISDLPPMLGIAASKFADLYKEDGSEGVLSLKDFELAGPRMCKDWRQLMDLIEGKMGELKITFVERTLESGIKVVEEPAFFIGNKKLSTAEWSAILPEILDKTFFTSSHRGCKWRFLDEGLVLFDFDRAELNDDAKVYLGYLADVLKAYPDIYLIIDGHADSKGTKDYNRTLGKKRAKAVKEYLVNVHDIAPERLDTMALGEDNPVDAKDDERRNVYNRNVQLMAFVIEASKTICYSDDGLEIGACEPTIKCSPTLLRGARTYREGVEE